MEPCVAILKLSAAEFEPVNTTKRLDLESDEMEAAHDIWLALKHGPA
jgi:hypothetical protein